MRYCNTFFFDTYAFFELCNGNPSYQKYAGHTLITSKLNMMEFHYGLLKEKGEQQADEIIKESKKFLIEFDMETLKAANKFRLAQKKGFSFIDCVGYMLALINGVPFVTGDEAFKGLPNVEFVK